VTIFTTSGSALYPHIAARADLDSVIDDRSHNSIVMIGPVPPPSSWPLEDVPGTILDIIVDYLADDAEINHYCDGGSCIYGIACFGVKPVVPLSPGLKNLSMVSSDFRHNVMARKIAHTVHLKSTSHIVKQRRKIRKETYACIR
jgi:hypothetical protein